MSAGREAPERSFAVDLGDGTSVEVPARPMRAAGIKRPERLADVLDELVRVADAGDAAAQYSLGRWLKDCLQTGSDAFCEGVPADRRGEAEAWLEQAASSGFLRAMLEQAGPFASDHATRFKIFEAAWRDHGHLGSLESLIGFYRRGWHPGGEPDYVLAYAHAFANLRVNEAIFANSIYPSHRTRLVALQDSLANLASYLTPQLTAEAEALGRRVIRENPNCCVSPLFGETP